MFFEDIAQKLFCKYHIKILIVFKNPFTLPTLELSRSIPGSIELPKNECTVQGMIHLGHSQDVISEYSKAIQLEV